MARIEREWHPKFIEYMEMIVNHPNYKGLPIKKNKDGELAWIAPAKSETGSQRIKWCEEKAKELGLEVKAGVYADVMLAIHPTKWKVCQVCGRKMSLYYHYPNANFLKSINKTFSTNFDDCTHISDIWDSICTNDAQTNAFASFLIKKGNLNLAPQNTTKQEIINALEFSCRKRGKNCLGPGAMSNFPDRYDGFHSYNRCCRSSHDTGRSKENLKSYTKDRRAYEHWNDGNIHAANQFMGSSFFKDISADHIGPISLGFVHDPRYLQPMVKNENSAKLNRLTIEDIEKIISTYKRTEIYPMSWYSRKIWEYITKNYKENQELIATVYRDSLKQNITNFMYILFIILTECPEKGSAFLIDAFLKPNYHYFDYSYKFNQLGEIIETMPRHYTKRNANEKERYNRIAIQSVYDYNQKDNRQETTDLTSPEKEKLHNICLSINAGHEPQNIKNHIIDLIEEIEERIILSF